MTMQTDLSELLKGCDLLRDSYGNVVTQSIRNMTLAFLTTPRNNSFDDMFENPMKAIYSNRRYGHMNIANETDRDMIIAPQVAVITSRRAQDHGMVKSAVVPSNTSRDYNDAGCIQGSVTGYIKSGDADVHFLPVTVREMLLEKVGHSHNYQNIYPAIASAGRRTGANSGHYYTNYISRHSKVSAEFIAHFERPTDVIGAIVFVDGEIIAIDKFPSYTYFQQIWDLLIRDCYGAVAIESMVNNSQYSGQRFKDALGVARESSDVTHATPYELFKHSLNILESNISALVVERVAELLGVTFDKSHDEDNSDGFYQSWVLKSEGYIGQAIVSGDNHLLVSIAKRDKFSPESVRETLRATERYRQGMTDARMFSI